MNSFSGKKGEADVLLAKAGGKQLFLSEIKEILAGSSKADSLSILNQYIETWIREAVVLSEAEKKLDNDFNLEELMEDYRSSLLLYNYEQNLVQENLDTTITDEQYEAYYENNKAQYLLDKSIVRCLLVKVERDTENINRFNKDWNADDMPKIKDYAIENADFYILDEEKWQNLDLILSMFPNGLFTEDSFKTKNSLKERNEGYEYFVKILEYRDKNEVPPLDYIRDKVRKVILHERQRELIENMRERLYQKELRANRIQVYTNG